MRVMLAAMALAGIALGSAGSARAAVDDIHYACALSADEESAETDSPGKGTAEFSLERTTQKLSWRITYEGLTTPAKSAGIYGPDRPGGNAGLVFDLAPNGLKSPLVASKVLNDGELQYLVTGRMYINIITPKYKEGELRCQLTRLREKPAPTQ